MKLIIAETYIPFEERKTIASKLGTPFFEKNLDGYSYSDLFKFLKKEKLEGNNPTFVSSNELFLLFHNIFFDISNIFFLKNNDIVNIQDCTSKELKPVHNIFKMHIAGAFSQEN